MQSGQNIEGFAPLLVEFVTSARTICCLTANENGTIVFSNAALAAGLGVTESQLNGRSLWEFLPHADGVALRSTFGQHGQATERRLRLSFSDADQRSFTLDCLVRSNDNTLMIVGERVIGDEALAVQLMQFSSEMVTLSREHSRPNRSAGSAVREAANLADRDPLTGTANRARLDAALALECEHQQAHGTPLTVVLLDIDHFQAVNDAYGQVAGDAVLREMGELLHRETRSHELVARYGGEEFVVVLPGSDLRQGAGLAERLRVRICDMEVEECPVSVTASFGVATMRSDEFYDSLLRRAEAAMHSAKRKGRNRVECDLESSSRPIAEGAD